MCDCLNKTEKDVKKKILTDLKSDGKKVSEWNDDSEFGFQCKGLFFSSGKWEFVLPMVFKYVIEKKDGTPDKRTTTKKTNFIPSYCPICGEKK